MQAASGRGGKGFSLRPMPRANVDSAPSSPPPAAGSRRGEEPSLTFPLRPLKSPKTGPPTVRPNGAKHRKFVSAATNARGRRTATTQICFIGGCFRIPLSANIEQHATTKKPRSHFQRLPTLTDSAFALCWPTRQQEHARDAAVGSLNRQVREQFVPLFRQEALVGHGTQHTPSQKENAQIRRLFAEIKQLRSILAFVRHPIQAVAGSVSRHNSGVGGVSDGSMASRPDSCLEADLSESKWKKEFNRVMEENARISQQNMSLQSKLANLVSILDIITSECV